MFSTVKIFDDMFQFTEMGKRKKAEMDPIQILNHEILFFDIGNKKGEIILECAVNYEYKNICLIFEFLEEKKIKLNIKGIKADLELMHYLDGYKEQLIEKTREILEGCYFGK